MQFDEQLFVLFFPDLVRALRPLKKAPFHVHLMVDRPTTLIEDFIASGADAITVHAEVGESEASSAIGMIRDAGRAAGLALRLDTPVDAAVAYFDRIDSLLLLGTEIGVKGQGLAAGACGRPAPAASLLGDKRWTEVRLIADGGIRRQTMPVLRRAGADVVVPGSLVFKSAELDETLAWLRSL